MATQGTSTVDFGSTGNTHATIAVTGQAAFTTGTNLVEAWVRGVATANNTADNAMAEEWTPVVVTNEITGTGFTLNLRTARGAAFGQYSLGWVWN